MLYKPFFFPRLTFHIAQGKNLTNAHKEVYKDIEKIILLNLHVKPDLISFDLIPNLNVV